MNLSRAPLRAAALMPTTFPDPSTVEPSVLDRILAVQLTVAWAGDGHGEAPGLAWWGTSLADPEGGGDFLQRMFPRTRVWAALGAMREAACRADEKARASTARADELITLFHFGFTWDEALQERFEHHKRRGAAPPKGDDDDADEPGREATDPASIFGKDYGITAKFNRAAFEKYLGGLAGKIAHENAPGAREIKGPVGSPPEAAPRLAGALLALAPTYPLPFYAEPGRR